MPPYLTDADVWRCFCAARLAELDAGEGKLASRNYDMLAKTLYDAHGESRPPEVAAADFHRIHARDAA